MNSERIIHITMDNRPIGVFDSGVGGLTALRALERLAPEEHIIYLGDTGNVPYGGREREELLRLSRACVDFLISRGAKVVLAACGTSSATALPVIGGEYDLPLFGILEPTAKRAVSVTKNGRIGVIATQATVASGAFEREIKAIAPEAEVVSAACPGLVPAIEAGHFAPDDAVARAKAEEALAPMLGSGIDTLILGCTHYPLMGELIGGILGGGVTLIDSGAEGARSVAGYMNSNSLCGSSGGVEFFVSGDVALFEKNAATLLGRDISGTVRHITDAK